MSGESLPKFADEVSALIEERLRIKGRSLAHQVRKLGRRVPRKIRRDADYLVRAQGLVTHPKLAQMVDDAQTKRARDNIIAYLSEIDPREVRKDKILIALAKISALGLAVVFGLIWFAWSRGMI